MSEDSMKNTQQHYPFTEIENIEGDLSQDQDGLIDYLESEDQ
jgi:hypothetical protein